MPMGSRDLAQPFKCAISVCAAAAVCIFSGAALDGGLAQTSSGRGPLLLPSAVNGAMSRQPQPMAPRAIAQAQPTPPAASVPAPPWSGEDGASGHPLMTAEAIRAAAANFDRCIANYWPEAAKRGI